MRKYIPNFSYSFLQRVRYIFIKSLYNLFSIFPLKKRVIFYSNHSVMKGNIKAIYENLKLPKEFIPVIKKGMFLKMVLIIKIALSKYVIVDDYVPLLYSIKFRKGAKFIQVWHAGGAFKRVGFSRLSKEGGPKKNSITHKNYTDVIVSSKRMIDIYSDSFGISKDSIKPIGLPRTDILFNKQFMNQKSKYEKKVILYAPTFRGDGQKSAHFNFTFDFKSLYDNFAKDYIFLISMHPFVKQKVNIPKEYNDFFKDISSEEDINLMLPFVDILITDYSSIIFEYLYFKKPLILFVPDINDYIYKRDFYFEFDTYNYGVIAQDNDELIKAIKDPILDLNKLEEIKKFHMGACDGNATARFLEKIIED